MSKAKPTANEMHKARLVEVFDMLHKIKACMDKESNNLNPNWGHVGSLELVKTQLGTIMEHYRIQK